ncbi:MAG TPA: carboxypeptidase regulatory-like domain-containing protein [Planctomycetes bacterium]|nr:carboxypeptidase regulatory-like domain-containing protein [Planctomycetota bacterium]
MNHATWLFLALLPSLAAAQVKKQGFLMGEVRSVEGQKMSGIEIKATIDPRRVASYEFWRGYKLPEFPSWSTKSDQNGRFRIEVPRGWEYKVTAQAKGYLPFEAVTYANRPFLVQMVPGKATPQEKPKLLPGKGSLLIQVLDAKGNPVPGVALRKPWVFENLGKTDEDGKIRVPYRKDLSEAPLILIKKGYQIAATPRGAMEKGKDHKAQVTLQSGRKITGRILDAEGKPMAGLRILCETDLPVSSEETFGALPWETVTDQEGRFRIAELGDKWRYWIRTILPNGTPVEIAQGIMEAEERVVPDLRAGPFSSVSGLVRLRTGGSAAEGRVHVLRLWKEKVWQLLVARETPSWPIDQGGEYRIPALVPGRYELCFAFPGMEPQVQVVDIPSQPKDLEVNVVLGPGRAIHGKVTDEKGEPIGGALLRGVPDAKNEFFPIVPNGQMDHNGRFLFGNVRVLTRENGTYLLERLRTKIPLLILVLKEGYKPKKVRLGANDSNLLNIVLEKN